MKASRRKLVDPMCVDIARHFLGGTQGALPEDMRELAEIIQDECEKFCSHVETEIAKRSEAARREWSDPSSADRIRWTGDRS